MGSSTNFLSQEKRSVKAERAGAISLPEEHSAVLDDEGPTPDYSSVIEYTGLTAEILCSRRELMQLSFVGWPTLVYSDAYLV
jgi:hypothetical protein